MEVIKSSFCSISVTVSTICLFGSYFSPMISSATRTSIFCCFFTSIFFLANSGVLSSLALLSSYLVNKRCSESTSPKIGQAAAFSPYFMKKPALTNGSFEYFVVKYFGAFQVKISGATF